MPETPEKALERLLKDLFSVEQLRRFLRDLPGGGALTDELPSAPASAAEVIHHAVEQLKRDGMADQEFFEALLAAKPRQGQRIRDVAAIWKVAVDTSRNAAVADLGTTERLTVHFVFDIDVTAVSRQAVLDFAAGIEQRLAGAQVKLVEIRPGSTVVVLDIEGPTGTEFRLINNVMDGYLPLLKVDHNQVALLNWRIDQRSEVGGAPVAVGAWAHPTAGLRATVLRDRPVMTADPMVPHQGAIRVFLSYSHDSSAHDQKVRELADRLRADGIDAWIDQYVAAPSEGWPKWMRRKVEESRFVVLICTEAYKRRFDGDEKPGVGKGATWEGMLATQVLYESGTINEKLIPVFFDGGSDAHIPLALRPYTHYRLPTGYDALYRHLTGQPAITAPSLGAVRAMPPVMRGPALAPQSVVSAGLPATPPSGTQTVINHGTVGQQFNIQGGTHTFNLGTPVSSRAAETTRMKILFLAANPSDTGRLALDKEIRGIRERLQMSELRDRFELVSAWAVRAGDLRQELLTHKPAIVHFAGHGAQEGLILEGQNGSRQRIPSTALASLFGLFTEHVQCVVLNACYSDDQAEAIAQQIPVVVGMKGPVVDRAGVLFADGLFQAIGHGRTIKDAVALGRAAYELEGITATAEPQIKTKAGVNAAAYVIRPPV